MPYSHNLGGWANLMVPIAVLATRKRPDRARHGRQPRRRVSRPGRHHASCSANCKPEQVRGRIILIPTLTMPAAKAATRLSPLDGKNFNRCFPGNPDGHRQRGDRPLPHDGSVPARRHRDRHPHRRPQHGFLAVRAHASRAGRAAARARCSPGPRPGTPTSASSTPTSPAPACCRSRPRSRARLSSPPRWAAART